MDQIPLELFSEIVVHIPTIERFRSSRINRFIRNALMIPTKIHDDDLFSLVRQRKTLSIIFVDRLLYKSYREGNHDRARLMYNITVSRGGFINHRMAVQAAGESGSLTCLRQLFSIRRCYLASVFRRACINRHWDIVEYLIPFVREDGPGSLQELDLLCRYGTPKLIEMLLKIVNIPYNLNRALGTAKEVSNHAAIDCLLAHGKTIGYEFRLTNN